MIVTANRTGGPFNCDEIHPASHFLFTFRLSPSKWNQVTITQESERESHVNKHKSQMSLVKNVANCFVFRVREHEKEKTNNSWKWGKEK